MKTTLIIFILALVSICNAQSIDGRNSLYDTNQNQTDSQGVTLPFEIGASVELGGPEPTYHVASVKFSPTYNFGRLSAGLSALTVHRDKATYFFAGSRIGYRGFENKDLKINIIVEQLFGDTDKMLLGVGASAEYGPLMLSLIGHKEFGETSNKYLITGSTGLLFNRIF